MPISEVFKYAARPLTAVIISLALLSSPPATVKADTNPVDLKLGGQGATSWNVADIQPTDNGTVVVELHNAGSKDGFVTIWVSDIINSEGINPESETGNIAEPGELADNLLLSLSSNRSSTNLKLPTTINRLPQSVSDPKYMEILPLKAGDTTNLRWEWALPKQTGNDAQGDVLSFTINYLLREFEITNVSDVVDNVTGAFTENVTVAPAGTKGKIAINTGTIGQTKESQPLSEIWIIEVDKTPSATSANKTTIGLQYELGPHGAIFDQPVTVTLAYNPNDIPERVSEADLVITTWDEDTDEWVELAGSTVDRVSKTISVPVSHFSRYTIVSPVPPPPPPPPPIEEEEGELPPAITGKEEKEAVKAVLETNMLGNERRVEIGADGSLQEPLRLATPDGNFIIEVDRGGRITSSEGIPVTRLELSLSKESIAVPGNIVMLSPIYKVTGYINELEEPRIDFTPPARLTILYDPRDLPENTFSPFIANYTDEAGLVRLEPPPDSVFEIGKAEARLHHASLFAVMAEIAPPPLPLPARFEASNLTINPRQAELGKPVIISLTIANEGAITGSYELYLIIDGIVRAVREITLAGQSVQTISFEVSNLAAGKHQVKLAGLTGEFQIIRAAAALPAESAIDWVFIDLSILAAIVAGLLVLYLLIRRSQRLPLSYYSLDSVVKALRHKNEGGN